MESNELAEKIQSVNALLDEVYRREKNLKEKLKETENELDKAIEAGRGFRDELNEKDLHIKRLQHNFESCVVEMEELKEKLETK